jgi:hypothetical protein
MGDLEHWEVRLDRHDLGARRAGNRAAQRGRWSLRWHRSTAETFPARIGPYLVTLGHIELPWGRSTHGTGYLTHVPDEALLIWRRGVLLDTRLRWRCGGHSWKPRLLDEPDSPICPLCVLDRTRREAA